MIAFQWEFVGVAYIADFFPQGSRTLYAVIFLFMGWSGLLQSAGLANMSISSRSFCLAVPAPFAGALFTH
jgi:hypothetical protein